jgi:hypothetical protein
VLVEPCGVFALFTGIMVNHVEHLRPAKAAKTKKGKHWVREETLGFSLTRETGARWVESQDSAG